MKEKMNVGEIIKVGLILFLITAILAALLAFVNEKTAPLIEENAAAAEAKALITVMPDAADFEECEVTADLIGIAEEIGGEIEKAYIAKDASGSVIGVCVITVTTGYDIGIRSVTGVDTSLTVTGVDIISMNETPGLGANADREDFRAQYEGKSGTVDVVKTAAGESSIQAIAGATKTSNGVTRGVNIALKAAEILLSGGAE